MKDRFCKPKILFFSGQLHDWAASQRCTQARLMEMGYAHLNPPVNSGVFNAILSVWPESFIERVMKWRRELPPADTAQTAPVSLETILLYAEAQSQPALNLGVNYLNRPI
jgi:hypothetical protein